MVFLIRRKCDPNKDYKTCKYVLLQKPSKKEKTTHNLSGMKEM